MQYKARKIFLIILGILGSVLFLGGIFYGGKKFGESRYKKQKKAELETKITVKENEIISLKEQLKKETNSTKKQELEQKVRDLEQQLTTLKNLNNFSPPKKPAPKPIPQNPPHIPPANNPNSDQVEMEIKITNLTEDENIRFDNNLKPGDWDSGKVKPTFTLISKKNPIWKGKNWDEIDWTKVPNFKISFLKKEATWHEKENAGFGEKENYYFDANNTKLTLTPLGNWPGETPGNPPQDGVNKVKIFLIYWIDGESDNKYLVFSNYASGFDKFDSIIYRISRFNPLIKAKIPEPSPGKAYWFTYKKADRIEKEFTHIFEKFNNQIEIYEA
ncbi:MAG: hypothetical protein I3270_02775 [Candidatus Moeniiplasma glomeromycotorum]|nr:hypothetical protein [Candidatus Moeniiplasma glomeromycotorum]MCE8162558.1 hypothetical protein [Candidatus Moeniiplasma glomeromycotorum]MCE8166546.1 hypothetical protein [Candidatus Moeniiplasma glomeromycotorum]MCE8166878.1 hypothetical protein [Candidatus Moeniiplasma glomeromycotorum]